MNETWVESRCVSGEVPASEILLYGCNHGSTGKVRPVGSTVNVIDASYINSIGDPELSVVWTDPTFDPGELAFYYLRVLALNRWHFNPEETDRLATLSFRLQIL
jgi:hypothetical protein